MYSPLNVAIYAVGGLTLVLLPSGFLQHRFDIRDRVLCPARIAPW
jgi:hypothetical protein